MNQGTTWNCKRKLCSSNNAPFFTELICQCDVADLRNAMSVMFPMRCRRFEKWDERHVSNAMSPLWKVIWASCCQCDDAALRSEISVMLPMRWRRFEKWDKRHVANAMTSLWEVRWASCCQFDVAVMKSEMSVMLPMRCVPMRRRRFEKWDERHFAVANC